MYVSPFSSESFDSDTCRPNANTSLHLTLRPSQVRIFTYAISPTANPVTAIRWIACANRGLYWELKTWHFSVYKLIRK